MTGRRKIDLGYTGINLENVKISNRSAILKLLSDHGPMSRKDIAMKLGLTPATVTLISTEFLNAGVLYEKGEVSGEKRAGRRKVLIDINYQYRYMLSICIEASETCIALCDLSGTVTALKRIPTNDEQKPEEFLKLVADEGKTLMWESGVVKNQVLGVGVSLPGPVNRKEGISLHAYRIWHQPVRVGEILRQHLEFPVIVENNVKAFAEGEMVYGTGKEQENLVFIKWGPGIGSAITIHNQIYDSQNSKTAEIGHYIVEKDGKLCRCGRRGCLETKASTHAIAEQVREACTKETMPLLYEKTEGKTERIEASNIAEWIDLDDPGLHAVLDDIIEQMARVVINTITMLAPDKVIIYGYMFDLPHIQERFLHFCEHYDPSYQEDYILKSDLSDKLHYIGPLAVAVSELFFMAGPLEEPG